MLAVQEPRRVYLDETSGTREQRQIARMIRHLRDQYLELHPEQSMPSDWLLEQLIINGAKECILAKKGWQLRVKLTLREIIFDTSYPDCQYVNYNNYMPLFPNNELFEPWEVNHAMKALLQYLEE